MMNKCFVGLNGRMNECKSVGLNDATVIPQTFAVFGLNRARENKSQCSMNVQTENLKLTHQTGCIVTRIWIYIDDGKHLWQVECIFASS